ncbi:hypothetical protein [Salisediminibacterium beveridgei]|uniref:Uncharacterized protein n=1 Tax=Salisediminibacterium beveridgei TaxID=632773 RepID=A0A1D7QXP0_9BACI|nr:hypothetical protein [Salisediminibacterium beveridgei]AOM83769.1 hypothetical protein BBEV_2429 [Salisediminibacterium beveridgei]
MLNEEFVVPGSIGIMVFAAAFLASHAIGFINPLMMAIFAGFIMFEVIYLTRKHRDRKPRLRVISSTSGDSRSQQQFKES